MPGVEKVVEGEWAGPDVVIVPPLCPSGRRVVGVALVGVATPKVVGTQGVPRGGGFGRPSVEKFPSEMQRDDGANFRYVRPSQAAMPDLKKLCLYHCYS